MNQTPKGEARTDREMLIACLEAIEIAQGAPMRADWRTMIQAIHEHLAQSRTLEPATFGVVATQDGYETARSGEAAERAAASEALLRFGSS